MYENGALRHYCSRVALCLFGILLFICCQITPRVERIFVNGHIVTMDEKVPVVEAMAVGGGRILAIGSSHQIRAQNPDTKAFDLQGRTVMPGIVESHGHLLSLGQSLLELNIAGVETPEEVVGMVEARVGESQAGEWITGWGWDEGAWARAYPDNRALSRISPDNPVYLRGLHGFACWANEKALAIAGITADTPDPPNGEIIRDTDTGRPAGILTNRAQDLLEKFIPPLSQTQIEKALELAHEACLRNGLTTVHEARTTAEMLAAFRSLRERNRLRIRIYGMLDAPDRELIEPFLKNGPEIDPDHLLTVRSIKVFVDGALGSRGAAFLEPYSDAPDVRGVIVTPEDTLYEITVRSLKAGLQVVTHGIGDLGSRITLNAYRRALKEVPSRDHRLRLEHAQVTALEDIPRFAPLGIVLSMQPPHATSDMPWAETRVGPGRIKGAYAWRSFLNTGVHLTLNSDFPGETLNPFHGMYAAETRQSPDGEPEGGWYPDQCLTRDEVLKAYTVEAAYSGFQEDFLGRISPGFMADFIVLSDDISTIPSRDLLSLRVEQTYVNGELAYETESKE